MNTLAQDWKLRLAELRSICRDNGEKLDSELQEVYRRQHVGEWWQAFCAAAEAGVEMSSSVWRSAEKLGSVRMPGYVDRLRVRNKLALPR